MGKIKQGNDEQQARGDLHREGKQEG